MSRRDRARKQNTFLEDVRSCIGVVIAELGELKSLVHTLLPIPPPPPCSSDPWTSSEEIISRGAWTLLPEQNIYARSDLLKYRFIHGCLEMECEPLLPVALPYAQLSGPSNSDASSLLDPEIQQTLACYDDGNLLGLFHAHLLRNMRKYTPEGEHLPVSVAIRYEFQDALEKSCLMSDVCVAALNDVEELAAKHDGEKLTMRILNLMMFSVVRGLLGEKNEDLQSVEPAVISRETESCVAAPLENVPLSNNQSFFTYREIATLQLVSKRHLLCCNLFIDDDSECGDNTLDFGPAAYS